MVRKFKVEQITRDGMIKRFEDRGGDKANWRELKGEELLEKLKLKLVGEAEEVVKTKDRDELADELGDVLDVVEALRRAAKITKQEIKRARQAKGKRSGKLTGKTYFETVELITEEGIQWHLSQPDKYPEIK